MTHEDQTWLDELIRRTRHGVEVSLWIVEHSGQQLERRLNDRSLLNGQRPSACPLVDDLHECGLDRLE